MSKRNRKAKAKAFGAKKSKEHNKTVLSNLLQVPKENVDKALVRLYFEKK